MNNWKGSISDVLGDDFFSEFQELFSDYSRGIRANIYERGQQLICAVQLPGLKLTDVDIYVNNKRLEVRGDISIDDGDRRLLHEEIPQGTMSRTIELPFTVRDDQVDVTYRKGLLVIHLQRFIQTEKLNNKTTVWPLEREQVEDTQK
ncbi:Hsp20/alpha crystallin family protein [Desertibacillus haloalkaliphilus]|uniref:Hsp20/alpha crystallin family protein n=1 Tax=Desertibacillus haloalkaliphilus TaxID=1328930 RepID=UPI001C2771D9|nr:Hsp20/alpha crystallin family protein [Desertibacillus haloalkaliphilus]MBU8906369.1 Hsp20/alpha crystallin family protein [Desertibacillus haloalkaliphilus]